LVELVNQVESYDAKLELDSIEPKRLEGGRYLQLFRFSAKFYDDLQNLRNLPLRKPGTADHGGTEALRVLNG